MGPATYPASGFGASSGLWSGSVIGAGSWAVHVVKRCGQFHLLQLVLSSVFPVVVSVANLREVVTQVAAELGTPVTHFSLCFITPPLECHLFNHLKRFIFRNHY